jgi:replicative DNA helicase
MVNQPVFRSEEAGLPQNIEAEQAVLGSLLIDPRAIERIASFLRPDDFYLPVNAEIFRGMLTLYERDMPTDILTVSDYLQAQQRLDDMGGSVYLASLSTIVPTSINVEYYARIVERLAVLRRLVDAGARISAIGYDERNEADVALEEAEKVLFEVSRLRVTRDFEPLANVLSQVYEKIDHIHSHESEITGITTGYIDLDRLTSGLQRSDLIILAGRPSMGKTAVALNMAHAVAKRGRLPVGIFSVEMSAEQLAQRLISLEAQVDSQKLRSGRMSDMDWDRLVDAIGVLSETPIFVDDTPGLSLVEMRSKARRLHSEQGLGLIIVDYLQLMQGASSSENRVQEISAISRGLKAVARELDVPVLALSQLSRAPEQRPNHEPMLSDLRESGSIEQDADLVMFIYRDVVYNKETERPHVADLIVAKHRNGPTGKVHLFFQESLMKFLDLSVHDDV